MEDSPSSSVEGNSKSADDDDVLRLLEDLETYAEDMKEDFVSDGVGGVQVPPRQKKKSGKKQYKKDICTLCYIANPKKCTCPKVPLISEIPEVMPMMQPIYHRPPEIMPIIQPMYHTPPEVGPMFAPFLYLFTNLVSTRPMPTGPIPMVPMYTRPISTVEVPTMPLGQHELPVLSITKKKTKRGRCRIRKRNRGGKKNRIRKENAKMKLEKASEVENPVCEIVES